MSIAKDLIGPSVHNSFIAIVNKFDDNTRKKSHSYAKLLNQNGFQTTKRNFYTLSDDEEFDKYQTVRDVLRSFPVRFVGKYQERIDKLFKDNDGDVNKVMIHLHQDCKKELEKLIGDARVTTILNDKNRLFFGHKEEEPEWVTIRTHTVGIFGNRREDKYEEKVIKFHNTTRHGRLSVQTLQRTWLYEQKNIILNGILNHHDNILIYSSDQKYDYVLCNISGLNEKQKKRILNVQLGMHFDEEEFGSDSSSVRSRWSIGQ